jgi:activator of 2-hydroxyglutaryl-CoA dehydratase/predicted nucleotide-binding protein (sugar kinase/HSP70/actin superfamily)
MNERVAGVDLGKAWAKFVVASRAQDGTLRIEASELLAHHGSPFAVFADWYQRVGAARFRVIAATGLHSPELGSPVISDLPEEACLQAALSVRSDLSGPLNLVSLSARGYSVLSRDPQGRVRFLENEKCSSGTGETILKSASRFGLSLDEADKVAFEAQDAIPITARCSVFAKSEMTHFGNQGRPADKLFRGYFDSIARYLAALLARVRVDGPVYVIGGGSVIATLRFCLSEHLKSEVQVPQGARLFEATGAAYLAAQRAQVADCAPLPAFPRALFRPKQVRFEVLPSPRQWAARVTRQKGPPVCATAACTPTILGLDLGSTGSKAVLTSIESGEAVLDLYDRTRGNPVEASQRLIRALLARTDLDVRAVGVTGSGREAVATVLRAAYPEQIESIIVVNEILAHAKAAIFCDKERGESLTVVEIGGQDAKFIQIVGGQVVESDMNKACSAGTGSFLEEQALCYGVQEIEQFTELAQQATRPPNLGHMCTVFVAEAAAEAESAGFELADIFAGFQFAVIHNYLNRVMGQRTFGKRIFFQGKPATGPSLAWTLAMVTDREVVVPPNPGAMGAWGVGLIGLETIGKTVLAKRKRFEFEPFLSARVAEREQFQCKDAACATLCNIERTTVTVADTQRKVFSGGACPKYEISTATQPKLEQKAPSPFDEREALLERFTVEREGEITVGVPEAGTLMELIPWATTFLAEIGLGVRVLHADEESLRRGEERSYAYDACAPVKVFHSVADGVPELLFIPKIRGFPDRDGQSGVTCVNQQTISDVVGAALSARGRKLKIVSPVLSLGDGYENKKALRALTEAAKRLGAEPKLVKQAARRAARAQLRYQEQLAQIGQRAIAYCESTKTPMVVVCGASHVIFDRTLNAAIPTILRQNGVMPLPMDCYPVPDTIDPLATIAWGDLNRALRVALAARERGGVYPLLLTSFGCGPSSFGEQIFAALMAGYPHTSLETDGHGGHAGYVTRIQSFLHGVREHNRAPSPVAPERLALLNRSDKPSLRHDSDARLVVFPFTDKLGRFTAACYRSMGFDAVAAEPASAAVFAHGRRDCSGKECLPYQLIWGGFRKHLLEESDGKKTHLVQLTGEGACRCCLFTVKDRISIEHYGLSDHVSTRTVGAGRDPLEVFRSSLWNAVVAWDIFNQLLAYYRPTEKTPGETDEIYNRYCDALEALCDRPLMRGPLQPGVRISRVFEVARMLEKASLEFWQAGGGDERKLPTVLLTGDVYIRTDPFANDNLVKRLNQRRLRVLAEPVCALEEYLIEQRSPEILGLPTGLFQNRTIRLGMRRIRRGLYQRVQKLHPWLPMPDVPAALKAGRPILDRFPVTEAQLTIGIVMHALQHNTCDGIVVAYPWGCSPALISESLLRHQGRLPMLFWYADGSAIDDRKLDGFAYRLHQRGGASVVGSTRK